jgi:hypothetical protein
VPLIVISGPAQAFADNPRSRTPIEDRKTLARLHGLVSRYTCVETFDEPPLNGLGLTGGHLRFVLAENGLRITTKYHTPRRLSEEEMRLLVEATKAQWSDGMGSGSFSNFAGTVQSAALGMAIQNSGRSPSGKYFVDAYPLFSEEEVQVQTSDDEGDSENALPSDLDYLLEAAAIGNAEAQFQLGRQYEDGEAVEQDDLLAFENYQKAADQGHLFALAFLGLCHQRGVGTGQDLARGAACFQKAAEAGLTFAMHCLGECYLEGRGVGKNADEGIAWYRRGVEGGDLGCTAQLGDCYENGLGVERDLRQARDLYRRCREGGFDAVEEALRRVEEQLGDAT